jgi:hypothetical protein
LRDVPSSLKNADANPVPPLVEPLVVPDVVPEVVPEVVPDVVPLVVPLVVPVVATPPPPPPQPSKKAIMRPITTLIKNPRFIFKSLAKLCQPYPRGRV